MIQNKKGVSEIIGYILLIAIVVVISIFVFQWLKSYVPQSALACPDGTTVAVPEYRYDCTGNNLNFTLQNTGTFSIAGYFIHALNDTTQKIATIDLTPYYTGSGSNQTSGGVIFGPGNTLNPGKTKSMAINSFDLSLNFPAIDAGNLKELEIIPIRYVEYKGKERIASCGNAKIGIVLRCYAPCVPSCEGKECGDNGCGTGTCGSCTSPEVCQGSTWQCVPPAECTDTCGTLGYACGTWTICGVSTVCGSCQSGFECNALGQCVGLCGNSVINTGEGCDDGNINNGDGCSSTCAIEAGFTCDNDPMPSTCTTISSCPSYCVSLSYSTGSCTNSPGNCQSSGGVHESGGDQWCTGGPQADTCCCTV